jgi:hypothetical protein
VAGQTARVDDDRARGLLAGPRGRRVLAELLDEPLHVFAHRGTDVRWPDEVRRRLAATDLDEAVRPDRLHEALAESVDRAMYWQEPDDEDRVLADRAVAAELAPLARAVAGAPGAREWASPLDLGDQHVVGWPEDDGRVVFPWRPGARTGLRTWVEAAGADEQRARRDRPRELAANSTGQWWSTPHLAGLVVSRRLPQGLDLIEDSFGWSSARTWPVQPPPAARVLEVTGPAVWADLVARHPLEVTASRRHDWWRVTAVDGPWYLPDWAAVAEEFDAVHLTVDGYLRTAGRALAVRTEGGPAGTVLAGWDPGTTWWLTDPSGLGEPSDWRRDGHGPGAWRQVGPAGS